MCVSVCVLVCVTHCLLCVHVCKSIQQRETDIKTELIKKNVSSHVIMCCAANLHSVTFLVSCRQVMVGLSHSSRRYI